MIQLRLSSITGDTNGVEEMSRQMLEQGLTNFKDSEERRQALYTFVSLLNDEDPYLLTEKSLRQALNDLPIGDALARKHLRAFLGASLARSGDWEQGLSLLTEAVSNSVINIRLWGMATDLAGLENRLELRRLLCVRGLALFANEANPDTCRILAKVFLTLPPEETFIPVIENFIENSRNGPSWSRVLALLPESLLAYRQGQFQVAEELVSKFLKEGPSAVGLGEDPAWAAGWFLRASIEMRLGHTNLARDAFKEGSRYHSEALRQPGKPYTGPDWGEACAAELFKHEAEKLLARVLTVTE